MVNEKSNETPKVVVRETSIDEEFKPDTTAFCNTSVDVATLRPRMRRLSASKSSKSGGGGDSSSSSRSSSSNPPPLSSVASSDSIYSQGTTGMPKLDHGIERICKNEELMSGNVNISTKTEDSYHHWECGFGYNRDLDQVTEIPNTKAEFIEVVKGEITTIGFIQNGLRSYSEAIHSGVHHTFSKEFLEHTTDATHKTTGQLFQVSRDLQKVVQELRAVEGDFVEVKAELKDAYAHAKPWIQRARAILVSSHVFYKINYVLGSEKTEH